MAKPHPDDFRPQGNDAGVAWNCKRCGAMGLARNYKRAEKQFMAHDCKER